MKNDEGSLAMDTTDRSSNSLTPWSPSPLAERMPAWEEAGPAQEQGASRPLNMRVILRALRRHWWQILALWLVSSVGLSYLAYKYIKPRFDVYSLIEVTPPQQAILGGGASGPNGGFKSYLDTQLLLLTSPKVLALALQNEEVIGLAKIKNLLDPETELRKELMVSIPQAGTYVIMVRMTDEDPKAAAKIVNAVVNSYIEIANTQSSQSTKELIGSLAVAKAEYEKKVKDEQKKVKEMYKQAGENPGIAAPATKDKDEVTKGLANGRSQMSLEEFRSLKNQLAQVQIAKFQAEADVNFQQQELRNRAGANGPASGPAEDLEARIQAEFLGLSAVAEITESISDMEGKLELAKGRVRNHSTDPATKHIRGQIADLKAQYQDLWQRAYPQLKAKLQNPEAQSADDPVLLARSNELRDAQRALQGLKIKEKLLQEQLKTADIEAKTANNQSVDVQFAQAELEYNVNILTAVRLRLEQLELDAKKGVQIRQSDPATAPKVPTSNNRAKMAMAAPAAMFVLISGLFILVEFRSARVADPDEFSQRIRLGVIGVVPPLPSLGGSQRALSVRGQRDEKRRIEEFVQSLDHLRVTLCAHKPGQSHRRCVLITSATGGEGKTTLAAQLAGRCANAGLMTLLIDADLRRPSLGDLLEVPEGPGLVDVLTGEATAESAMVVIGNAGGFHLLPAGTMGQDPSRLLHGDRLGQMIAQFRETFDIVIIDAPPVLAVPDALLLGRWTDGAVLAVRHDTSRFPLVERANKRLASVGVRVLGAVVNGCRTMESSYGSYRYTPYATASEVPSAGGTVPQDV